MLRRSRFLLILILCSVLFSEKTWAKNQAEDMQEAFIQVAEDVGPAVVSISTMQVRTLRVGDPYLEEFLRQFFGEPVTRGEKLQTGLGSGVIIDKQGYILTNEHVVANADEIQVTLPDGRKLTGVVTGSDSHSDLAIVKIPADTLPVAKLGDSDQVRTGEWAIAIGNPFGYLLEDPKPTLTVGVVSALHRSLSNIARQDAYYGDLIQTDAPINAGNSGGPLVNIRGEVIGINAAIISPSGASAGLGFAIPINRAKRILEDLKLGKDVAYGWIGVWIQPIDEGVAKQLGLSTREGLLVFRVEPGSPAAKAGLKQGDVMAIFNENKLRDSQALVREVNRLSPGTKVPLVYYREGRQVETTIEIGERSGKKKRAAARARRETIEWRGLRVQEMTQEAAGELGVSATGVMVVQVQNGSPADIAGLRPGDIIDEMNKKAIEKLDDFYRVVQKAKGEVLIHTNRGYCVVKI